MKEDRNLLLSRLLSPKTVIFALAVANCVFISSHQKTQQGSTISFCAFCPWYENWSFTNEPSLILLAAFFLLLSKRWSSLFAAALSGYVVIYISFFLIRSIFHFGLFELLAAIPKSEQNFFLIWELQIVWAAIVVTAAFYYLARKERRRR
jgi:hypothetical protein